MIVDPNECYNVTSYITDNESIVMNGTMLLVPILSWY